MSKNTKKVNCKPDLVFSMDEKVYLAVAQNIESGAKRSFVYALVCNNMGLRSQFDATINEKEDGFMYSPIPLREMYTFDQGREEDARTFYETISQISAVQTNDIVLAELFEKNKRNIERFENCR